MDSNGLNFWMLSSASDWLPPGGSDTLYFCPDKQRLRLRSRRTGKAPQEDFSTASSLVEKTPMTQDTFGNYARWDSVQEKVDAWGKKYYLIGGNNPGYADTEDSDFKAIAGNSISITPLHLDWTNYASFETLLKRRI